MTRRELLLTLPLPALTAGERTSASLLSYRDKAGRSRPVRNERDWRKRVRQVQAAMQEVMGPLPAATPGAPAVTILGEEDGGTYLRRRIDYMAEDGDRVSAFLLLPKSRSGRAPAVLCLHQTVRIGKAEPAGLGGSPHLHYAQELAQRGYVALAPDYPNFGDYHFDPYQHGYLSATMKGIRNHRRAVDLLVALPEVASGRLAVMGHSLGGHNSLFVAAFEPRLRAVVTSCGFTSFARYYGGNLTGWSHRGYMPRIASVYQKSPARMPFDFPELLAALAPRPVFVNAPLNDSNFDVSGVRDCVQAAREVYQRVFHDGDHLVAVHPDSAHDFPDAVRLQAYDFLDRWLGQTPKPRPR